MVDFEKLLKESRAHNNKTILSNIMDFVNMTPADKFDYVCEHPNMTVDMIDFLVNQTKDNKELKMG